MVYNYAMNPLLERGQIIEFIIPKLHAQLGEKIERVTSPDGTVTAEVTQPPRNTVLYDFQAAVVVFSDGRSGLI